MPKLDIIELRVTNPRAQIQFYCDTLGMTFDHNSGLVGYSEREARLLFTQANSPYQPTNTDLYWKITLAVPHIELAVSQLMDKGVSVSAPQQFQDVGYVAHFADPEGFNIELIDHWFDGNRPAQKINRGYLGGGAHLNLLTLRAAEITQLRRELITRGMKPLSVQPVDNYGFTLYFFGYTTEQSPGVDLVAIENREWLYQRPYTLLEIQHVHGEVQLNRAQVGESGFAGVTVSDVHKSWEIEQLLMKVRSPV